MRLASYYRGPRKGKEGKAPVKRGGAVAAATNPPELLGLPANGETEYYMYSVVCVIFERRSCENYERVKKIASEKIEYFPGGVGVGLGTLLLPAVLPLNAVLKME